MQINQVMPNYTVQFNPNKQINRQYSQKNTFTGKLSPDVKSSGILLAGYSLVLMPVILFFAGAKYLSGNPAEGANVKDSTSIKNNTILVVKKHIQDTCANIQSISPVNDTIGVKAIKKIKP